MISKALRDRLAPEDTQDDFTREMVESGNFLVVKRLKDGSYAGISNLMFTRAIHLGVTELSWERRFCYDDMNELMGSWDELESRFDEPTGWIATRPDRPSRYCSEGVTP